MSRVALVACAASLGVALPFVSVALGGERRIVMFPGTDAASIPRKDSGTISRTPPDPAPMRERSQWVYHLRFDHGDLYLAGVQPIDLARAEETPRAMGRFALELFEGPTLIERVRFDFPGVGAEERDAGYLDPPRFEAAKTTSRIGVMFPASSRGTRLELWDRATDRRWPLPWPPETPVRGPGASDARAQGDAG